MSDSTRADPGALLPPGAACPRCGSVSVLVLFGATGDLTRRKLIPAIYSLTADGLLPCGLPIVSIGRRAANREALLAEFRQAATQHARRHLEQGVWEQMAANIHYVRGELSDAETYRAVSATLDDIDRAHCRKLNCLFYLAIPPHFFDDVLGHLVAGGLAQRSGPSGGEGEAGRASADAWPRIVVEKPFGHDLASAQELNRRLRAAFSEPQIFRMDHYLGKETVQNLLVLRFANAIFEPLWNQKYIGDVQINMAESIGLEGRGAYFDRSGTLRDVVQNHLLELLALVAMEPPVSMDADAVRDEKSKLLRSVHRMSADDVARNALRAHYTRGEIEGETVPGYLEEEGVAPGSRTETFVALRLAVDNWRWAGVPFLLRAGKRLPRRVTEIIIRFKQAPHLVFQGQERDITPNTLALRIQPREGITLCFSAKEPGPGLHIRSVPLVVRFAETFHVEPPEAYERLILDALLGDNTLFARSDTVEESWRVVGPVLEAWEAGPAPLLKYPAGAWAPPEAEALVPGAGEAWCCGSCEGECQE